ncbi:hypothetical protein LAJ57_13420, partial [Streptococcus pneumoniae]|uniref:hypothetical protein n=1 Tax=Streptococcus pneumoniae TaxID=1313 RepID=UPI001CC0FB4D
GIHHDKPYILDCVRERDPVLVWIEFHFFAPSPFRWRVVGETRLAESSANAEKDCRQVLQKLL